MDTIIGLLIGSLVLYILLYAVIVVLLYRHAINTKTNGKGIKNLRFQEHNSVWNKYINKYT